MIRFGYVARLLLLTSTPVFAAFHYIHYNGRNGPFNPIYEKFSVASGGSTISFFVSDQSPAIYAPNDSFGSVLSQVKQAVAAWNAIPNSDLHLTFGGLENPNQNSNTAGGDVIFEDLPPGLLGMGAPLTSATPVNGPNGAFYPIVRGVVRLSRDTTKGPGPSYLESFFTTAVHEIGHALGLQHTWTSSAMSQDVIRNTSRARPLDADDIASFSILYGKANWQAAYGSISGRVTYTNGQPVVLGSVVAITAAGPALSSLTDPNGNYRIDGLPPTGNYLVYAHPLPPGAIVADGSGLQLPVDQNRVPFQATGPFQTVFYPNTLDPNQAQVITIGSGTAAPNINFSVQAKASVPVFNVVTYCKVDSANRNYIWSGEAAVTPAFISTTQNTQGLIIVQPPVPTPLPQSATILGLGPSPFPAQGFALFPGLPQAAALYFSSTIGAGTGSRHLVLNYGTDIYVLPDAVNLVQKGPPVIKSATVNADGSITVSGAGFGADSTVYFDGLQAATQSSFTGTDAQGTITVIPPQGGTGQVATLTVYNSDGQNSMILQPQNAPTYSFSSISTPQINSISLTALPSNSSATVDITTSNTNFVEGQVTVGFGSDDVTVRRVWVLSPTHLIANVVVAPGAALGFSEVSVISGMQILAQPAAFQVQPARAGFPALSLPVVNTDSSQQTIYPGSIASLFGSNLLAGAPSSVQVTLNDLPLQVQFASATQVNFFIPAGFATGPATLRFSNGAQPAFPVTVQIDAPPPSISALTNFSHLPLAGVPSAAGDILNIQVTGLDSSINANSQRLRVTVSGIEMTVLQVNPMPNGASQIEVILKQSFGGSQVPLMVWVDGSSSAPVNITVR